MRGILIRLLQLNFMFLGLKLVKCMVSRSVKTVLLTNYHVVMSIWKLLTCNKDVQGCDKLENTMDV